MKRWFPLALFLGFLALALPLPQVYDRLEEPLKQVRLENPTQALSALDQVQSLLRQEGEGIPPVLRDAALVHLQDARQAVARKSAVDLEARLLLVRHLLGKALYDGFFQAPAGQKAPYLTRLVRATGLPQSLAQGAESLAPEEARRRLEAGYLQLLTEDLGQALSASSRPQAYLALARAYARFLVIQDSPQSTLKAQDFVQALGLVSSQEGFRPAVKSLAERVQAWRKGLEALQARAKEAEGARATPPPPPEANPQEPPPPQPSQRASPIEPALAGLDPKKTASVAEALQALGFQEVLEWLGALDTLQAITTQAMLAAVDGDYRMARQHLTRAWAYYLNRIRPVVEALDPPLADRAERLIRKLQESPGLREVDILVLQKEFQEVKGRLFGESLGPWHTIEVQATLFLTGIPRAVLILLAAILTLFPIYLGRITFGGRNVYWTLLGIAFLLLALPIMSEGLSYMGSILAEYGGLPILGLLANLSIAQGLLPYLAWGISAFLVVAFAGAGLRGIAAQFGLLKERGREVAPTVEQKQPATLTSETIVEWDEEF